MNNHNIIWFGRYEGWLRMLARGVKNGDAECIRKAGRLFDLMLPDDCVVVPMPSHTGEARQMLAVANDMPGNRCIMNVLRCEPHVPSYEMKKAGLEPSSFRMWLEASLPTASPVYIIDNVICTGATAGSALGATYFANAHVVVCTLAYSPWAG